MSEGEIGKAGLRDLRGQDRVIRRRRLRRVPVDDHEVRPAVILCRKALQQRRAKPRGKARAVDAQILFRQLHGLDGIGLKNMDVFRPAFRQIGRARQQAVMVAGADEDRRVDRRQRPPERQQRLLRRAAAVKQIAGQQHDVAVLRVGGLGQVGQQRPLLLPPRGGLLRRERGKRRVQMQIGRMQKFNQGSSPFLRPCSALPRRRR